MRLRRSFEAPREQYSLFDSTMPLRDKEDADALPKSARDLIEVMGLDATIDLVKVFGGDDIQVPYAVNGKARMWAILIETVGPEAATKLVERYAANVIYVPKCQAALMLHRDRDIQRRFDEGVPFDTLRRELNCTRRHLYRVLKKPL